MWCALSASAVWRAPAEAQALELDWNAPSECGTAARVQSQLTRLLRTELDQLQEAAIDAHAHVVRSAGGYRLRLQISTASGTATRQLHAARCDELVEVTAWLIALAVDPTVRAPASASGATSDEDIPAAPVSVAPARDTSNVQAAPAPAAAKAPSAAAPGPKREEDKQEEDKREERSTTPASRSRPPVPLGLQAGGGLGLFAGAGADVQATLSALLGLSAAWSYSQLRLSAILPRSMELSAAAGADVWSWSLGLSQCAQWGGSLRGGPCAVLTGLRTSVETQGVNGTAPRQQVLWATAGPGFTLAWQVWRGVALTAAGHVGISISPRPRFSLEPVGPVISAQPWTVDAQLGVSFVYP